VFESAERAALIAYRGPCDGFHAVPASVTKTLLVRFDYNKYAFSVQGTQFSVEDAE
jgi:hypothetical protein